MTLDEMQEVLEASLTADKVDYPNLDTVVAIAVQTGLKEFWGAHSWSFKSTETTMTVDGTTDDYDLPDNFSSIKVVREENSTHGRKLQYRLKEDFDKDIPRIGSMTTGDPVIYTIYYNGDDGLYKIKIFPNVSSSTTLYIDYYRTTPADSASVPDKFAPLILTYAAKNAYPFGHIGKMNAQRAATFELKEMIKKDKIDDSRMTVMQTTADEPVREKYVFEI